MSVQVGLSCYADTVSAGGAACVSFVPVSNINGDVLTSITCESVDSVSGALNLHVELTSLTTGGSSFSTVQQSPVFPACVNDDYLIAFETLAGALLAAFFAIYGAYKILGFFNWSRGDHVGH